MKCLDICREMKKPCDNRECRMWNDYKPELNCTLQTVDVNGGLSLREAAARLGISFVRVKQIEDAALDKLLSALVKETGHSRDTLTEGIFY